MNSAAPAAPGPTENQGLISFLSKSIEEKEKDLECPVCLETAGGEIFCCIQQHLLCSQCRPRVAECPLCRQRYPPTPLRHRYAEKIVGELERLREELGRVVGELNQVPMPSAPTLNLDSCGQDHGETYQRKYLPEFQDITGNNLDKRGPREGHFCPEMYFEGPVMAQKMESISLQWEWRDQGHGNRKGMLWVQLVRGGEVLADSREDYPTLAPHVMESKVLLIKNHSVVNLSRPGDKLRFMINVGGGGGHQLKLRNFKAKVEFNIKQESPAVTSPTHSVKVPLAPLDITGNNLDKRGPSEGHFCPETYFEGPVMAQKMESISLQWEWRDQGHGNRKGMLWVQLVRGGEVLADSREDYPTLAPHVMESKVLLIKNHSVVNLSRPGDKLRFMINVGGGGGHQLKLRNFKAKVEFNVKH